MAAPQIALVGTPNCGKTALFNLLTGSRQKVANYPGVTVEKRSGEIRFDSGVGELIDLPGTYSLHTTSQDERVTREYLRGALAGELPPDLIVAVVDATNLRLGLRLVLELQAQGRPLVLALNLMDLARARGLDIDIPALSALLGIPVVETVAIRRRGAESLRIAAQQALAAIPVATAVTAHPSRGASDIATRLEAVESLLRDCVRREAVLPAWQDRADRWLMHPLAGSLILIGTLFLMFQAVFAWAEPLMNLIEAAFVALGGGLTTLMPDSPLRSLLVDGVIAGVGGVLVFLPQIMILFAFILLLEDSGYLPRAAFLLDRSMQSIGLSGRAFIPLLSSFACAIPGIMAARTISNPRERLLTIMLAPLMTCSARLPVYALIIAAFIPERTVAGLFNLQGIVLFALYVLGIASTVIIASFSSRLQRRGHSYPLLLELPSYRWPSLRNLLLGLRERAMIFLRRVGGMILAITVLLWFLSTYPAPPPGALEAPIYHSYAGMLGRALEVVFAPIGFNWQISIALVPGMAAREVAVGALGTVYALSAEAGDGALIPLLQLSWSLPTALSFLAWYVYAPQCLSTLIVAKRETNSWRYAWLMAAYLFALAYAAAFVTFRLSSWILG